MTRQKITVVGMVVGVVVLLASCSTTLTPSSTATEVTRTATVEQATAEPRVSTGVAQVAGVPGETTPGAMCGPGPSREAKSPEEVALAQEIGNGLSGMDKPYRNTRWNALSNDGTFAHVLVCLQMRKSSADTWHEYIADAQFSKVGGRWRIDGWSLSNRFEPVEDWNKSEASMTAASKIHAEIVHTETRDRPKDLLGFASREHLATVRWTTEDHTQHVIQYNFWFSVSGHDCLPDTAYVASDAKPRDAEQQFFLSLPLRADGTADMQAPTGQVTVGPDAVQKMYYVSATLSNKESLQCSTIDNPHGQQLRITAVDGTYLRTPLDAVATPSPR